MMQSIVRFAGWINADRVRRQAALLAIVTWTAYAITIATPGVLDRFGHVKGTDFLHFYTQGSLALQHRGDLLYSLEGNLAESERLAPEATGVYFVPAYGPQFSLLFAPFAKLPYLAALALWTAFTVGTYVLCIRAIVRLLPSMPRHRSTIWLLAAAFPGFAALVMFGQNSDIALVAFTLAFFAFRSKRSFLAGCALGLLAYKPQLALAAAAVLLLRTEWRAIAGALTVSAVQVLAAWFYFGSSVLRNYVVRLSQLGRVAEVLEPKPYLMHSLRTFWSLLLPWPGLALAFYIASTAAVIVLLVRVWRRDKVTPVQYAVLLIATVLITPHLSVYDLVLLAPALLILGDWVLHHGDADLSRTLAVLIYVSYWVALLGPITGKLHVQVSVLVFAALFWFAQKIARSEQHGSVCGQPEAEVCGTVTQGGNS